MTNDDIRRKAAILLMSRDNAWTQGDFRRQNDDGTYAYCMVGACREAIGVYLVNGDLHALTVNLAHAFDAANLAAVATYDTVARNEVAAAVTFNDAPGRTRDEVVAALLKGIEP